MMALILYGSKFQKIHMKSYDTLLEQGDLYFAIVTLSHIHDKTGRLLQEGG